MQEPRRLWEVANERPSRRRERVVERHVDHAVEVLDVEDDGIAAGGAPAPDQFNAAQAPRRPSGQINAANLRVPGHGDRLLDDGLGQEAWDRYGVALLEEVVALPAVRRPDSRLEIGNRHKTCLRQVSPGDGGRALFVRYLVDRGERRCGGRQGRRTDLRSRGLRRSGGLQSSGRDATRLRCGHGGRQWSR